MERKAIFLILFTTFSCQQFSFEEIYEFVPTECVWYDSKSNVEYKCDDPSLKKNFMMVRMDEYVKFKENWKCTEKENLKEYKIKKRR